MRFTLFVALYFTPQIFAETLVPPPESRQIVVVETAGWTTCSGNLQRFERSAGSGRWRAIGPEIPVKVGRAGLAWGVGLHTAPPGAPRKVEGDGKAPAGVFRLPSAFGREAQPAGVRLPYLRLSPVWEAVDDPASHHYNEIVDRSRIAQPDWRSSEKMGRVVTEYALGVFVAHNPRCVPGAGSCIFLHVWKNPQHGTTGCTAMPRAAMAELQRWLDPAAHPVLLQAPGEFLPKSFTREARPSLSFMISRESE